MVADRRTAVLIPTWSSHVKRSLFGRSARTVVALSAIALSATLGGGCANGRSIFPDRDGPRAAAPPVVVEMTADVHANFATFEVIEVAVRRPGGDVALSVKTAFRAEIYEQLLAKGYSPLALEYVDAARDDVGSPGRTFPMRCVITKVLRSRDGGVVVSGWLGLVAPQDDGSEVTLYLAEVEDLAVPPLKGPARADGGPTTGTRLAEALLRKLPSR